MLTPLPLSPTEPTAQRRALNTGRHGESPGSAQQTPPGRPSQPPWGSWARMRATRFPSAPVTLTCSPGGEPLAQALSSPGRSVPWEPVRHAAAQAPQLCKQNPHCNKIQGRVYLLRSQNRAKQPAAGKPGRDEPRGGSPRGELEGTAEGGAWALGAPPLSGHACNVVNPLP